MWSCMPMIPGISVRPVPSTVAAPAGTFTFLVGPTSVMTPFCTMTVWPGWAAAPVPSISSTLVIATTAVSMVTYAFVAVGERGPLRREQGGRQRQQAGGQQRADVRRAHHDSSTLTVIIMPACRCSAMWQCSIHGPGFDISTRRSTAAPARHKDRVLPGRVVGRDPVHRQDQEPLAVEVDRVLHRVQRLPDVHQPDADQVTLPEPPVDLVVLLAGGVVPQGPLRLRPDGGPVHPRHRPGPLDRVVVETVHPHQPLGHERQAHPLGPELEHPLRREALVRPEQRRRSRPPRTGRSGGRRSSAPGRARPLLAPPSPRRGCPPRGRTVRSCGPVPAPR